MTDNLSLLTQHFIFYVVEMIKFVFIFLFCALLSTAVDLPTQAAKISGLAQNRCRILFHKSFDSSQIIEAFLCGVDLPEGEIKSIFIQTSLYHLIVVSGSHLSFLLLFLSFLRLQNSLIVFLASCGLALITGFQAPIVRALVQSLWHGLNVFCRWHWRGTQELIIAAMFTLSLFPMWVTSLSFQLSLGAVLSLKAGQLLHKKSEEVFDWTSGLLCYLFLLPLLMGWGQLHPAGILTNLFLAPVLTAALWVISALWLFLPIPMDYALSGCVFLLREVARMMPLTQSEVSFDSSERWFYLLILMSFLWGLQIHRERSR